MEAKLLELRPVKTYIDKNHLDEPIKGKLLVDFISDMTGRKNRTESYKSQYNVLANGQYLPTVLNGLSGFGCSSAGFNL